MTSSQFGQQLIFEAFKPFVQPQTGNAQPKTQGHLSGFLGRQPILAPFKFGASPYLYKVVPLQECPVPEHLELCDTPEKAAAYWRRHIPTHPFFSPECEAFCVLILNTRRRIKGHSLVSVGTQDSVLIHPREVFRLAIATAANAVILAHNHPSGDPSPSESDIKITRDLIRAGQLLKIEVLDHIIIGNPKHVSLRELGYFYT